MVANTKPTGGWSQIYNSIFEQSLMGIVLCGMDGSVLECNPAFCRMLGYTSDELRHKTVEQLTHPEDWAREVAHFSQPVFPSITGSHYSSEKRYFRKDGRIVWANVHATTIHGANNAPVFGFAIVEDITERKHAEELVRESESRYRSLFSEMTSGFALHEIIMDEAGKPCDYRFLDVNPAFEALTGLRRDDVIGKTVRQVIPNIEPPWIDRYGAVALTGIPATFEDYAAALHKHFSVHAYSPKSGLFAVVFTDVTELNVARERLADEKERLSVTLRSIGDGVVATDTDGNVVTANKVIEQWLSQSQQDLMGPPVTHVLRLVETTGQRSCAQNIENAVRRKQRYAPPSPLRLVTGGDHDLWVTITGSPIFDRSSAPIGMVFVLRDVTEHLRMQEERIKTEKLESLGHLAAGIAHDFNNLLTTILGNVSLAKTRQQGITDVEIMLADAEDAVQQARLLTQQLLTFARGGSPVKETINAGKLIQDAAEFALHGSASRPEFQLPAYLWKIEADPHQLSMAIRNIVLNADQAMPYGGSIRITAENTLLETCDIVPLPPGRYIKIAITDSGVGIAERHLTKIFDPYFTTKQHGSGMGLATTMSIVKNHGGHLAVQSRLGIGTTFYLYLPAVDDSPSPPSQSGTEEQATGKTRVLVMDDEEAIRNLAVRILTHNGFSVTATSNGGEAVASYEAARSAGHPFDVVILDLTIRGGMGGRETMARLMEMDPAVKAIVSSGYSNDPVMANYRKHGFRGIVPKPYQAESLVRSVMELAQSKPGA